MIRSAPDSAIINLPSSKGWNEWTSIRFPSFPFSRPESYRPDDLLGLDVDLGDFVAAVLNEQIAVLQQPNVVNTAPLSFPLDLAILIDDGEPVVSLQYEAMFSRGDVRQRQKSKRDHPAQAGESHDVYSAGSG